MNQHMDVRNRWKLHLRRWKCAGNAVISPPWILSKQNGKGKTEFMLGFFQMWSIILVFFGFWFNEFWLARDEICNFKIWEICAFSRDIACLLLLWVNRRFWTLCLNLSMESVYLLFNLLLFWWCLVVMEMVCELLADSLTFPWIPYLSIYK